MAGLAVALGELLSGKLEARFVGVWSTARDHSQHNEDRALQPHPALDRFGS